MHQTRMLKRALARLVNAGAGGQSEFRRGETVLANQLGLLATATTLCYMTFSRPMTCRACGRC